MTPREIQAFPSNLLVDGLGRFFGYSPEDLRNCSFGQDSSPGDWVRELVLNAV